MKVCGQRDEAGVRAAVAADADFVGFIVAPDSRRRVETDAAARLAAGLGTIRPVLVFRGPEAAEVDAAVDRFAAAGGMRRASSSPGSTSRPRGWPSARAVSPP